MFRILLERKMCPYTYSLVSSQLLYGFVMKLSLPVGEGTSLGKTKQRLRVKLPIPWMSGMP